MGGFVAVVAIVAAVLPGPAGASVQDDAGSGSDAGDSFETATLVAPRGPYSGRLDRNAGDRHDFYRFEVAEGSSMSVRVTLSAEVADPVELLDPDGVVVDAGAQARTAVSVSPAFTGEGLGIRLAIHRARVGGEYRLHLRATEFDLTGYHLCFMNCEGVVDAPIDMVFGGSLPTTRTKVLLVPPSHGDLGNPSGPTVVDYLDATLRGIHGWTDAIDAFVTDHPRYAYLDQITIEVELFDGVTPVDPVGYDVIVVYVAAGPAFRGVASDADGQVEQALRQLGLDDTVRFTGRVIALSLFGSSPRAGQVLYDFPEVNDLEIVTLHEFGHTFGLGHTRTWHPTFGPDLMNSPATFVYGDGFAGGDGGERTPMQCLSSLDLVGLAHLYRWLPDGTWRGSFGSVGLPSDVPYGLYC